MLQLGRGRALEHIVLKLEELGYRWSYRVLNTLAFGLPQRRERVFLLASLKADPADVLLADEAGLPKKQTTLETHAHGFYWTEGTRGLGWAPDAIPTLKNGSTVGIASPPAILLPSGNVITPDIRDAERLQGFETDWTSPAERVGRRSLRWSLIGNAVSVPVAKWLGEKLHDPGRYERARDRVLAADGRWPKAARYDGLNRHAVMVSTAPCHIPHAPLHEFLLWEGTMLSVKATTGFLKRADASTLRFVHGFKDALRAHLRRLLETAPEGRARELDMKVLEPASGVDLFALERVPGWTIR
jgi:DNA (cytosine-5)-methyltransferase 1